MEDEKQIIEASGGLRLSDLSNALLDAIDPDKHEEMSRAERIGLTEAVEKLVEQAVRPLASEPELRSLLQEFKIRSEQVIDEVSEDIVLEVGFSEEGTEKAKQMVDSFRQFIEEKKDEITALEIIFSQPPSQQRLTFQQIKELAVVLEQPPNSWTTESMWRAYAQLQRDNVRGASARRVLTDVVSLVRHAVELDEELAPYPEVVQSRYRDWLAAQEAGGKVFTQEQRWWLDKIAEHTGVNLAITQDDFNYSEFFNKGGQVAAVRLFGAELLPLLDELNAHLTR